MRAGVRVRVLSSVALALLAEVPAGSAATQKVQRLEPVVRSAAAVVEAESLTATARVTAGAVAVQDMRPFGTAWGGHAQLFWQPPPPQETPIRNWPALTVLLDHPGSGRFTLVLHYTVAPDYGTVKVLVDGKPAVDVNGWASSVAVRRVQLGEVELTGKPHQLVFTVFGKDDASTGYFVGLDRFELIPVAGIRVPAAAAAAAVQPQAAIPAKVKHKNGQVVAVRPRPDEIAHRADIQKREVAKRKLESYASLRRPVPLHPVSTANGLRILTYNVCAFPEAAQANFTKTFVCDGGIVALKDKAARIAQGIRRAAPDIVVINEAWDESFRLELASQLESSYPHAVLSIDGFPPKVEDSGLMLLSKLPFAPLRDDCQELGSAVVLATLPDGPESVCASIFDDSEGDDSNASKAVGLAKLRLSANASVYVAFAHLQADDEYSGVRHRQLRQVEKLIERCGPTATERATAPVFFAGDLNIPGRLALSEGQVLAQSEWRKHFQDSGRVEYFSRGEDDGTPERVMADAYAHYGSPKGQGLAEIDPGASQGMTFTETADKIARPCGDGPGCEGERYDYVFQSWYRPYRLERVRLGWEVNSPTNGGGRCNLSDHQPLVADYHTYFASNQSVRTAKALAFADSDKVKTAYGSLPSARAMQWYRLEGPPGLYGILASSARVEVFAQNDLSRALAPYPGSSGIRVGPKFDLAKPPYFIRVYPKEGQTSGQFELRITRIDCSSPDQSCPLTEGMENKHPWPTTVLNGNTIWANEMWFSFLTNVSSRQEAPELEFAFTPMAGVCPGNGGCNYTMQTNTTLWKLDLLPSPHASPPAEWVADRRRDGSAMVLKASNLAGGANGALKEYLLRVTRAQEVPANASTHVTVEYRTPLTYVFIGSLNCSEEWQGFGDPVFDPSLGPAAVGNDDVFAQFAIDSGSDHVNMPQTLPTVVPAGWTYWGSFYEQTAPAQWPGPNDLRYLRSVRVDLVEWDPPVPDGNANDPYTPLSPAFFGTLAPGQTDVSPVIQWATDDYDYQLVDSRVMRRPFECVTFGNDANGDGYPDACQIERVPLGQ
jgi:hypothetical protein